MKKLYILLAIGFVIALIIQFPYVMINPGELTEKHQKLKNECLSCHKPFGGIVNEKCLSCHKLTDIGMDTTSKKIKALFHHQIAKLKCSSCHTEHQGIFPEHKLSEFNHKLLSSPINSNCNTCHSKPIDNLHKHVTSNCKSCHQTQSWKNSESFNHESLLNKNNCVDCHQNPKDNLHNMVKESCDKCHGTSKWVPSNFDHSVYFKLDQNHTTSCKTCHLNAKFNTYTCFGCHEHTESEIIEEHNEEGIYNITNCVSCHKSGNENDITYNYKKLNENEKKIIKEYIKSK